NMAQFEGEFIPNAYIRIAPDNTITLIVHRSEMGQGVATALPMILADELDADLDAVRTEQAPPDRVYGDQVTGGSQSISGSYNTLRVAGARARAMLLAAAALTWRVDAAECRTELGTVLHDASGQSATYGELAETAATLPVPGTGEFSVKDPADFRYIGQPMGHRDNLAFVTGQVQFCSDLQWPGLLVTVVARCPVYSGDVAEYDASAALAVPGVQHVVEVRTGIAVVAETTWAALQGRDALQITWDEGSRADWSSESLRQSAADEVNWADDSQVLEATYEVPYLAHAPMEPMTCVADVREDAAEVWAPTQNRQEALSIAANAASLPMRAVTVHVPLIGGAFGRRLENDYVREAVEISRAVGAPVKLFWTREDDMQHDFYHPYSLNYRSKRPDDDSRMQGRTLGYASTVPTGAWRSVDNFPDAFANECFIDELAIATDRDPLEVHLEFHAGTPREPVLQTAADNFGWDAPLPEGRGKGIAVHSTFGISHVAMAAEVEVANGRVRVHRVVCAIDCGFVVNPDAVMAQMEGGIVFGLTAALYGEITVENGRTVQSNFHDYPLLQLSEMPQVEVFIVPSDRSPVGVGEMGVPPVAPAVFNAIYDATGIRVRRIPVRPEDLA
ncbi:MAG: xanthine dehydrogenase family protein molybdopterin-binding subunit, partial [Chloroflexi bacterium]|nr:xanthine dehydrogenase family protein molybdopterin-binding subunit [Chloroflexota bacterium]